MKILVVRACAIGDFVLNLPALRALARRHASARFTLVGYPSILDLARDFIDVEAVHSIDAQPWASLFYQPIPGLAGYGAAWVWMKDGTLAENLEKSGVAQVHRADPFPIEGHAARHLLGTTDLEMPEPPDLWQPGSFTVLIHPGSGSRTKVWPHFDALASALPDAAVILGPCEADFKTHHPRLEHLPLRDVAHALCRCRAFVGSDSGIAHIAAYWGAPTIALFGPTDPQVWGPVGRRVSVLRRSLLADISVEEVLKLL